MRRELIDCHIMAREREIYETMTEIQLGSRLVGSAKSEARQPSRQHSRDWATALSPIPPHRSGAQTPNPY